MFQKEEINQSETNTLMRTVQKTHNFQLREKYVLFEFVSGQDPSTITIMIIMDAGKRVGRGGPKSENPAMRDEHTHAHC